MKLILNVTSAISTTNNKTLLFEIHQYKKFIVGILITGIYIHINVPSQ